MEPPISLLDLGHGRYRVSIDAPRPTTHEITVPEGYLTTLGLSTVPVAHVVEESVRFLLEREPNTSILRAFSLPVIADYFPEYAAEIARRLAP
jgi:hypothetical protein